MAKKKTSVLAIIIISIVCLLVGVVLGGGFVLFSHRPKGYEIPATISSSTQSSASGESGASSSSSQGEGGNMDVVSADLSVHFLELGTKYTGDCTLIKVGDTEVLIDAGAKTESIPTLSAYINRYCTDGVLEYVIVTHAHEDHYAGFATNSTTDSIFDLYECKTIITFSQITTGKESQAMYKNFMRELGDEVDKGAVWKKANEVAGQSFTLSNTVTMKILYSTFYDKVSSTENNHSVCTLIEQDGAQKKNFLFTGDLEKEGEEGLVKLNSLPKVDVYKAGHHGSKTSSNECLLQVICPKIVCVCCCAGSSEYTKTAENQFPTQAFIDRVAPYTKQVYITTLCVDYKAGTYTSFNGNIVLCSNGSGNVEVNCSNNNTLLKDSDWFKQNRTCPAAWQ